MNEALIVLILGTATPGGGFPLYGAAFAEMVNAQEPRAELLHPGVRRYLREAKLDR